MKILRNLRKIQGGLDDPINTHLQHVREHQSMVNLHNDLHLQNEQAAVALFSLIDRTNAAIKQYKESKDIYAPTKENINYWKDTEKVLNNQTIVNREGKYYVSPKDGPDLLLGDGTKEDAKRVLKSNRKTADEYGKLATSRLARGKHVVADTIHAFKNYKNPDEMKIIRNRSFSEKQPNNDPAIKVVQYQTLKSTLKGATGASSRRFRTDSGYEFDDPVITHWNGSKIVGFTDRATGKVLKDPGQRLKEELDKMNKKG